MSLQMRNQTSGLLERVSGFTDVDTILNNSSSNAIANKSVYNALAQKIEKTVTNLVNYYDKSQLYTRAEVRQLIGAINTLTIAVVSTLPTSDISTTTIYFVGPATGTNTYDEYVYANNAWVKIGDTDVDLTSYITSSQLTTILQDYYTKNAVNALLDSYYTKTNVDNLLDDKQDTLTFDNAPTAGSTNVVKSGGVYTALQGKANSADLGTAASKDVATSGDATNVQVVLGNDSRLSDARPASDVSAWAKAAIKPTYTATEVGAIASTEKGTASGVAELDANGKVPSSQLPSYVDDVKEGYLNSADGKFYEESTYETEITPEVDKIYVDKATNITYRWSGSAFVAIGSDLALGETSTTAYRGDRGKAAYDHATDANKISTATASGFYKVGATAEGHVSDLIAVTKTDITNLGIPGEVDTELSSTSTNPVQNKVILEAFPNKGFSNIWETKIWNITPEFSGNYIWSDGNDTYLSIGSNQYVFNKSTSTWTAKTWSGLTRFNGNYIWSDGDNIYFSDESDQYVLNKSTSTWTAKTWSGLTDFRGLRIWSDGDNVYYSDDSDQYILDKSTSTWNPKTWSGFTNLDGNNIWSDGDNVYYSYYSDQYILDKSTSTWNPKTWSGFTNLGGEYVWTDGDNIYYSNGSSQYVLNKSNSTWSPKTWSGLESISGDSIWSDGDNIYYSYMDPFAPPEHYVLEKVRGFGSAAARDATASVTSRSNDLVTSGAVYTYVDTVITQALNGSY